MMRKKIIYLIVLALTVPTARAFAQSLFTSEIIPLPPQSVEVETYRQNSNINLENSTVKVSHYRSALSPGEILDFYSTSLSQNGWQELGRASKGSVAMGSFTKGEEAISINAYTLGQDTEVFLSRSKNLQVQAVSQFEDMPGRDLPWAPRYPDSLRRLYREDKDTGVVTLAYNTADTVDRVINFYQQKMPDNGWQFVNDVQISELPGFGQGEYITLFFEGFRGKCQVSVNRASEFAQAKDTTAILVNYIPR